ncbi:MAG: hypothetical protein ACWGQW_03115 [bacterium]
MSKKRVPIELVMPVVLSVTKALEVKGQAFQPIVCGSIRRGCKRVADIDIVVPPPLIVYVDRVLALTKKGYETGVIRGGSRQTHLKVGDFQVDLYEAQPDEVGAMVMFLTGSPVFNIKCRARAKGLGLLLNQYGVFREGKKIAGDNEAEMFKALKMDYLVPAKRSLEW